MAGESEGRGAYEVYEVRQGARGDRLGVTGEVVGEGRGARVGEGGRETGLPARVRGEGRGCRREQPEGGGSAGASGEGGGGDGGGVSGWGGGGEVLVAVLLIVAVHSTRLFTARGGSQHVAVLSTSRLGYGSTSRFLARRRRQWRGARRAARWTISRARRSLSGLRLWLGQR